LLYLLIACLHGFPLLQDMEKFLLNLIFPFNLFKKGCYHVYIKFKQIAITKEGATKPIYHIAEIANNYKTNNLNKNKVAY